MTPPNEDQPLPSDVERYRAALEASMDEFIGSRGPVYLSALRQAFMAGAMFQLKYNQPKPKEIPS